MRRSLPSAAEAARILAAAAPGPRRGRRPRPAAALATTLKALDARFGQAPTA